MPGFEDTGGVVARTGGVSTGAAAKDIKTLYKAIYLKNREPELVYQQFAQKQADTDLPLNKGDNVEYTRYAPLDDNPSARPYHLLAEGTNPEAEKYYAQTVTAVIDEYGNYLKPSSRTWLTAFDPKLGGLAKLLGTQAGKSLDLKIQCTLAKGLMGMRGDSDATYQGQRIVASVTSTSIIVMTAAVPVAGVIVFVNGKNEGLSRTFTGATNTVTLNAALPYEPAAGDLVRVISTLTLASGDAITPALIKRAVALLETMEAPLFPDGFYHSVIPAGAMKYDFMNDTEYINLKHYAAPKDLYRALVGEFHNVRFHKDTHPYKHTAGTMGTYVKSADPQMISIFGSDAFGNIKLKGVDQKFYINPPPAEGTTTNPLAMYGTIGWKNIYAPLVLNGAWGVNIFCVPTDL